MTTSQMLDERYGRTRSRAPWWLIVAGTAVAAAVVVGAGFIGVYGALSLWLWIAADRLTAAGEDLPAALLGLGSSAALLVAALWLEYSCRIPPSGEDTDEDPPANMSQTP